VGSRAGRWCAEDIEAHRQSGSEGEVVGIIANPYEEDDTPVLSPRSGIVIGATTLPIVNLGDALFHIAWAEDRTGGKAQQPREREAEPLMDEDEII
jgi:hypothetical protein